MPNSGVYNVPEHLIIEQVLSQMASLGCPPHDENLIADGYLHRYTVEGDKLTEKNGSYTIYTDGCPAWYIGDWKRGINATGKFDDGVMSGSDREGYRARLRDEGYMQLVEHERMKREQEERERKIKATAQAEELFRLSPQVSPEHGYIRRKSMKHIEDFRQGQEGELLIPLSNAETSSFQSVQRIWPDGQKYFFKDTAIGGGCYSFNPDKPDYRLHFICEGVATGDTVYQLTGGKYRVTCAFTCHNLLSVTKAMKKRYPRSVFIVAADNDTQTEAKTGNNPGRKRAQFVVSTGYARGIVIPYFKPNEEGSDWNDYYLLHGEAEAVKEFTRQLDDVLSTPSPAVQNSDAKDEGQVVSGKDIFSMRDDFLKGRNLMFYGSIRNGEYYSYDEGRGYWYRLTDAGLQASISKKFHHSLSTRMINDLTAQVRVMVTQSLRPEFNKLPLFGFSNCVFDFETQTDRGYRPDDLLTWQVDYPFNPSATCPRYDAFLQEVSCGEQSRIDFLDDMPAYALYTDCRLHKMFFLIGEGGNGKGVYLHTLESIFRNTNPHEFTQSVTHIEPKDLKEQTKIVLLEHAIVNIAYDINPDLRGCEEMLKLLSGGDVVTGNRKFHDTHSFTSRAKLISSCNSMPILSDGSYGMERRPMFCKFEAVFKKSPDTRLTKKLNAERSGIFNRIYRAYKAMLEREAQGVDLNNIIRASIDQQEALSDFSVIANPVAAFWEDTKESYMNSQRVLKREVYSSFCDWCRVHRRGAVISEALSENIFHKKFKKRIQELGLSVRETRTRITTYDGDNERTVQPTYYVFSSPLPEELQKVEEEILRNTDLINH